MRSRYLYLQELMQTTWVRWAINLALLIAIYLTAELGRIVGSPGTALKISVLWAPTGISLAALLLFGFGVWPGIFLGNFCYNFLHLYLESSSVVSPLLTAMAVSAGSLFQAFLAAYIMRQLSDPGYFNTLRDVVIFLFPAGLLASMIASTIGVLALYFSGNLPADAIINKWMTFWLGDSLGIYIFTPLIIIWSLYKIPPGFKKYWGEAVLMALTFLLISYLTYVKNYPLLHLGIPLCLWIAYRFRMHGASLAIVLICLTAIIPTSLGWGGIAVNILYEPLLTLVSFLEVVVGVSLTVAALLNERVLAWARLEDYSKNLESKVEKKSAQLKEAQMEIFLKEKLASLGVLAFGIGRQLQSPLKKISEELKGCRDSLSLLMQSSLGIKDRLDEKTFDLFESNFSILNTTLEKISSQTDHCKEVVEAVIEQSAQSAAGKRSVKTINLHTLIHACLAGVEADYTKKHPEFAMVSTKEFDNNVNMIDAIPEDLTHAFKQILEKAFFSMHQKSAHLGPSFEPHLKIRTSLKNNKIEVQFQDNGQGLSPEAIEDFFAPFSPKEVGGLGLAIAHDIIVAEHHGEIQLTSREGEFTTVKITLSSSRFLGV